VPAVFLSPKSVFVAMRNESSEDIDARSEPVLALTALAGVATALASSTARNALRRTGYDALSWAFWAIVAGGFIAFEGLLHHLAARSTSDPRGLWEAPAHLPARQGTTPGFAVAPIALSSAVGPLQLALYGAVAGSSMPATD
jgi:hypothetical protein